MFDKLNAMKAQMEESKKRLDTIFVEHSSSGNAIAVECSANYHIKDVRLSDAVKDMDKEELEDLLVNTLNEVLKKAKNANESEMKSVASGLIPGLGGFGL